MILQADARCPLAFDLFCGKGGWTHGLLAAGWRVIGFDIERWPEYPGLLVIQDVLTLDGRQLRHASLIVASPPCNEFSYRAMPWKRAKALPPPSTALFDVCFRIQREASAAAGHHIPMVVENVRGAQKWVGPAKRHFGSYYLWGDVPALMPYGNKTKAGEGKNLHVFEKTGKPTPNWSTIFKQAGSGPEWFDNGLCRLSSAGLDRKAASAEIAKIPFPLARWIGEVYAAPPTS